MPLSTRRALGGAEYDDKVMGYGPIAYWSLPETSGTVARCLPNVAMNGTYNSDVSGWPPGAGIGDGYTMPYFDGANDTINVYSATLNGLFNGQLGSLLIWARLPVAAWTDGTTRIAVQLRVDANNLVRIEKNAANNLLRWYYIAGGASLSRNETPVSTTVSTALGMTWNRAANQAICYRDGAQVGAVLAGLGLWAGNLDAARCAIGSDQGAAAVAAWNGWGGRCAVWDRVLAQAEFADLATL